MTTDEKEFVITHDFKNISSMKNKNEIFSPIEEHFGVPWKICVTRNGGHLELYLYCEQEKTDREWSIETWWEAKIVAANGQPCSGNGEDIFENNETNWGWKEFIKWKDLMKDYVVDDTLKVEFRVKIKKMTGIETGMNLMRFDGSTKEFSDVILVVENRRFHVLKLHLARYSTFFKTLFLGISEESGKSEVSLQNIAPDGFQKYLEVLHGEPAIDDDTVEGILKIAEMYGSPVCVKRCEQFLMEKSQKSMVDKFGISMKFKLENLQKKCIAEISSTDDLRSVVALNMDQIDLDTAKTVLRKFVSL